MMTMMMQVAVLIRDQVLSTALPLFNSHSHFREGEKIKDFCEADTLNILILQMRKLRLRMAHLPKVPFPPPP